MARNLIIIIFWMVISSSLSSSWSSSINSLFTARSAKSADLGSNKDLLESVGNGAQMALDHCQSKFKWDRWNCPESAFSRRSHQPITKEAAFVSALTAAGIVYSITRNCSRGELPGCSCDSNFVGAQTTQEINTIGVGVAMASTSNENPNYWTWGGCSDHLDYGEQIAKNILDSMEKGQDQHATVNLHNNGAGRMMVRTTMQKRCRCHGVSGSCSMQTCWMQMAPFAEITNELRIKYEKAHKIDHNRKFNSISENNILTETRTEDLIYLTDSPDYCKYDSISGWNGTKGRSCSRNRGDTITPAERKSCKNLCRSCGHRVRRERRRLTRRCNCTFQWCCEVKCDTCTEFVDEFFCE